MRNFSNINDIVNANATEMVNKSKWITWYLNNKRKGVSEKRLETIAYLITQ
jgi:hypothetical protein